MKNKSHHFFTIALLVIGLLSCGSSATRSSTSNYSQQAKELRENGESTDRVILKNANLTVAVEEPDGIQAIATQIAKQYGGYISASSLGYAGIKVKAEHLETALEELSKLGKVKSRSINTQDVTEEYTDFKIRLENAEKARNRYQELLTKATTVAEILPIEKELQRVTEDIERLTAQIDMIEHKQALSRIDFYWHKRVKPGPIGYVFVGLYKVVKVLFVRGG